MDSVGKPSYNPFHARGTSSRSVVVLVVGRQRSIYDTSVRTISLDGAQLVDENKKQPGFMICEVSVQEHAKHH